MIVEYICLSIQKNWDLVWVLSALQSYIRAFFFTFAVYLDLTIDFLSFQFQKAYIGSL